ncbi:hypothetical protein [Streptomyces sp. NPDC059575]|uniref:hypothetical protein n=1 Tax=Streptomyces sp. NPDC059575 TaxID=3346872 RepID=UPI0036A94BD2
MRANRSSPAVAFWDQMQRGDWSADPYFTQPPDGDQIHNFAKLLAKIEYMGEYGVPASNTDINSLREGIWEFKHHHHRLAYFDTPGNGTFEPKGKIRDRANVDPDNQDDYWWYPRLDSVLRLTNAWSKQGQLAPPEEIDKALTIREEDVQHDR